MIHWDARQLAQTYYEIAYAEQHEGCSRGERVSQAREELIQAKYDAFAKGVAIWQPSLVVLAWPEDSETLFVELALGELGQLKQFMEDWPWKYVSYMRLGRRKKWPAQQFCRCLRATNFPEAEERRWIGE